MASLRVCANEIPCSSGNSCGQRICYNINIITTSLRVCANEIFGSSNDGSAQHIWHNTSINIDMAPIRSAPTGKGVVQFAASFLLPLIAAVCRHGCRDPIVYEERMMARREGEILRLWHRVGPSLASMFCKHLYHSDNVVASRNAMPFIGCLVPA
jgi:hypothetical protein